MSIDFQSMCTYWKQFNLPELQKSLDTTANDLAQRQEKCDSSRKKLVELSREFKRNTPDEVRKQVSPLLKSFQQEIDTFSKRSKFAESAFLNLYKKLIEVQDPVPLIENCVLIRESCQRFNDKEQENTQLRETLAEYQREFADVKNQEVTIKNLKEKITHNEDNRESEINNRLHEIRRDFDRANGEKQQSQKERELSLIKQLSDSERRVTALDKAMEKVQNELFDLKCQFDQNIQAKSDEMDLVLNDVDVANEKTASVERENERLKSKLSESTVNGRQGDSTTSEEDADATAGSTSTSTASATTAASANGDDSVAMLRAQLSTKEQELNRLVEELQRLHSDAARLQLQHERTLDALENQLKEAERVNRQLTLDNQAFQDYDELKRELSVLKSMEFSNDSANEDNAEGKKTLDSLLMGKNRTLQTDNTRLKLANGQLTNQYESLEGQYAEAFNVTQEQKTLITKLEEDLRRVNAVSTLFRPDAEGESSSQIADVLKDDLQETQSPADCLLPIVISQRERFHDKAKHMQVEHVAQKQQIQVLTNEMDKLRIDNVKLFEKIKFLQSYSNKKRSQDVEAENTEERYKKEYESKLDPFTSFSRKEKARKYSDLRTYERIMLSMGRLIMSSRTARSMSFIYFLVLHLLVFCVLYKLAYSSSVRWDLLAECNNNFARHMQEHGHN